MCLMTVTEMSAQAGAHAYVRFFFRVMTVSGNRRRAGGHNQNDGMNKSTANRIQRLAARSDDPHGAIAAIVDPSLAVLVNSCGTCGKSRDDCVVKADFGKCSRCMRVYYCSRECQRANWKAHKPFCTSPATSNPTSAPSADGPSPTVNVTLDSSAAGVGFSASNDRRPAAPENHASSPYNTSRICGSCFGLVRQIDWSPAEWDKRPSQGGRCLKCQGVPRQIPAAGSAAHRLPAAQRAEFAALQAGLLHERSAILQSALARQFSVRHSSHVRLAPVAYAANATIDAGDLLSLQQLDKYEVAWRNAADNTAKSSHFKFIGVGEHHACDLSRELDGLWSDERYSQGGLLYMLPGERAFWSMVVNWHNHGSTLPFPGPCARTCGREDPDLVASWQRWQRHFDAIFAAATANPFAVRCMFVDTEIGCLARPGTCPFAH